MKYTKSLLEKLENHKKLLSMVSDKLLPIKQTLIEDTKNIIYTLEMASKQEKREEENNK